MLQTLKDKLNAAWEKVKTFFKNSLVIFYARLHALVGTAIAIAGAVDWQQVASLDWTTPRQTIWIGLGLIANGVVTELLRRRSLNA